MDAALAHLREGGCPVRDDDVARVSPLGFSHSDFLGRYTFTYPELGRLRPARPGRQRR
jgi:hypothetical protein